MTQEEKQILLMGLCARLPYGVEILADIEKEFEGGAIGELVGISPYNGKKYDIKEPLFYQKGCLTPLTVEEIRPYLRPMSSMTEEERIELSNYENPVQRTDFFYSHHIDCRFMIEKGLALEAPEGMYKTEQYSNNKI